MGVGSAFFYPAGDWGNLSMVNSGRHCEASQ